MDALNNCVESCFYIKDGMIISSPESMLDIETYYQNISIVKIMITKNTYIGYYHYMGMKLLNV